MLPEIAAEALLFLTRRDLDKASAVSKWLDAMIAQCCEVYPLRPVDRIELRHNSHQKDCSTDVWFTDGRTTSFSSMNEAAHFAGLILRHSYVEDFQLVCTVDSMRLSSGHWTTLVDAMRVGSVDTLYFHRVDFSALDANALQIVAGCRGLQSLVAYESIVPSEFVTDSLIRSCAAGGLLRLRFPKRKGDAPFRLSEDALLDFIFAAGATQKELELQSDRVTDMFVQKFFERLLSSPVRPSGSLKLRGGTKAQRGLSTYARYRVPGQDGAVLHRFPQTDGSDDYYSLYGAEKQRGLPAYASYLVSDKKPWADAEYPIPSVDEDAKFIDDEDADAIFRFPSTDEDNTSYEVQLSEDDDCFYVDFHASQ